MFEDVARGMSVVGSFVRATQEERRWTEGAVEERGEDVPLSGEEASDFYRNLLAKGGGDGRETRRNRKDKRKDAQPKPGGHGGRPRRREAGAPAVPPGGQVQEREGHRLLRCAQDGDVRGLNELLRHGCDVNFRDTFYWTPVMCASHAGQTEAVRLLLQAGAAWVGVVDTQGRDARDLALHAGHQDVVSELEQFIITEKSDEPVEDTHSAQWCAVCEVTYTDSTHTHISSTLHQFSVKRPLVAPYYCLPPSSASYRMMLRSGWDPTSGLGPSHTGRKHPIGTVLKRDQAGLGYGPPPQNRVTHFQAKDPQAVRRVPKEGQERKERGVTLSVRALRKREERERGWERSYRTSFYLDV